MSKIDLSRIYFNRRIPKGYYMGKVVYLVEEHIPGKDYPRVAVQIRLYDEPVRGVELCSILHPTEKSRFYHANFVATFRIQGLYKDAVGRWGCIEVLDAEYNGTKYSAVKYIYQKPKIKHQVIALEIQDEKGLIQW